MFKTSYWLTRKIHDHNQIRYSAQIKDMEDVTKKIYGCTIDIKVTHSECLICPQQKNKIKKMTNYDKNK